VQDSTRECETVRHRKFTKKTPENYTNAKFGQIKNQMKLIKCLNFSQVVSVTVSGVCSSIILLPMEKRE